MAGADRSPSPDERWLVELAAACQAVGLDAVVVGATAAVLQGAPLMTQDVDLLVRSTVRNQAKLQALARALGGSWMRLSELSSVQTLVGCPLQVDILFDALPGGLRFELVKSRALRLDVGGHPLAVATLADVIASKRAANRPKDRVQLPLLEETARIVAVVERREG